jgi:hypothetical protein
VKPILACVQEISSRAEDDGTWRLSIDELSSLTGIPATDLYSAAYRLGDKVNFSDAVDGFSDETVGELLTSLEEFYETDIEATFTDYGVFLPHDRRLELMANFMAVVQHEARQHEIDQDTFVAMLLHFKSFEESFQTYVEEFFDLEAAIDKTAQFYRRTCELPQAAFHTARNYLKLLFVRKILQTRSLFVSLRNDLAELAWSAGFVGSKRERYYTYGNTSYGNARGERFGEDASRGTEAAEDAVRQALKTMQLRREDLSPSRLKQQYKRLMKRYHPDVNPEGLEMSKRITSSYSVLLHAV